ncbi:hypothetical protein L1049_028476 [Liquidambar formosana]|uniref:K+ potassium transporter integral membrane domain-containing protein n=1 Tax=Liquidambar formosana TaxID=63359 RepID=A0AAP0RJR1_LIQFO
MRRPGFAESGRVNQGDLVHNASRDFQRGHLASRLSWVNLSRNLILAYQSFGVVYGDLSTSPLSVYSSTFIGKLQDHQNEEAIFGAFSFSLIFWTLTLIPLLKYIFILLSADDNGEADEELSAHKYGPLTQIVASSPLKRFLEKHKRLQTALLLVVLFGACMVIGDGVLTPEISGNVLLRTELESPTIRDNYIRAKRICNFGQQINVQIVLNFDAKFGGKQGISINLHPQL